MQRWIQRATIGLASLWLATTPASLFRGEFPGALFREALFPEALAQTPAPGQEAQRPGSSGGLVTLAQDLTLTVSEDGPNQPWTVTLANRGSEPLGFIADPGLLWFDVSLPGRPAQSCRLPQPLRPSTMQRKSVLVLHPGEQYSRRLDPRFFCFAELGQILLVPRAKVTPNFGWLREITAKSKSRPARRATSAAPAPAGPTDGPFVAWRLSAPAGNSPAANSPAANSPAANSPAANSPAANDLVPPPAPREDGAEEETGAGPAWRMPAEGLKSVQGATLELTDSYAAWVGPSRRDAPRDIELVMLAGSDAEDERNATVSFGLINTLERPQQIFVRRELLDYDVQGPDGFFACPSSDVGSPDFASFSTLPPHGAERAVVRLIEICPRRSFARPGLYEVHARLAANWSGQELGLDAFVGQLEAMRPAFVRVRSGDRSSFARLVVPTTGPRGATPGAAAAAPGEADAPDAPPAEEAPADNSNGPEEAPATPEHPAPPDAPPVE
jgi:hypothetical protein